jgi:hypothetical protein
MKYPLENTEVGSDLYTGLLEDRLRKDRNDALTSYSVGHENKFVFTINDFVNPLFSSCIPKELINKLIEYNNIIKKLDIKQDDIINFHIEYAGIIVDFFDTIRGKLSCPHNDVFIIKPKCEFSGRGVRPTKFHLIEDKKIKDKDMKLFLRKHSCNLLTADFSINSFFNSKNGKIDDIDTLAEKMEIGVDNLRNVILNKKLSNEKLLENAKRDISFLNKILKSIDKIDGFIELIENDYEIKKKVELEKMFNEVLKNAQNN